MPGQVEVQGKQLQLQYQAQNGAYCIENRINEIVFTATEGTTLPNGAVAKLFVDGHEAHEDVGDEHHEDACERERAHGARRDGDAAVGRLEKVHDGGHQGTHLAKPSESSGMKATRIATMIMMRT